MPKESREYVVTVHMRVRADSTEQAGEHVTELMNDHSGIERHVDLVMAEIEYDNIEPAQT